LFLTSYSQRDGQAELTRWAGYIPILARKRLFSAMLNNLIGPR